ncbi:MAG: Rieske (2Fe-2S) protein [Pseudomonadota bacterium]
MIEVGWEERWEPVCHVAQLKEGRLIERLIKSTLILLAWYDEGPWAGSGLCPHQFARLSEGWIQSDRLHCARHQASFCMRSGDPDDRWQINGIKLYRTRINDEIVEVNLDDPA